MTRNIKYLGITLIAFATMFTACSTKKESYPLRLTEWKMAPAISAVTPSLNAIAVTAPDDAVKESDFSTANWLRAVVPSTVLGNLVDNGVYDYLFEPDNDGKLNVYFNENLSKIPPEDFDNQWWYSTDFTLPASEAGKRVTLTFRGISYVGEVYVNGTKLSNKYTTITEEDYLKNGPTLLNPDFPIEDFHTDGAGTLTGISDWETYKTQFIGSMRTYDLDITDLVNFGRGTNNVKVKITKPVYYFDLTYHWVDWNPMPADAMMGLTGDVYLSVTGSSRLANPAVASKVAYDHTNARLSFFVDVNNFTSSAVTGTLNAVVRDPNGNVVANLTKDNIRVPSDAYNQEIILRAAEYPQLTLTNPQLWWPYMSGGQPLYTVDYEFIVDGVVSDRMYHRFGIREITEEVNVSLYANSSIEFEELNLATGHARYGERNDRDFSDTIAKNHLANMQQFYFNHRPVMLKGGGYCASDLMLRHDQSINEAVVEYTKYMGMNMHRDEGKFFSNDLLELMDENGIVLMTGWCCCDRWQQPGFFSKAERFVAFESMYAQLRNARRFACMFLWYNGSDEPPSMASQGLNGQNVEQKYFEIAADVRLLEIATNCSNGTPKLATLTDVVGGQHMDASYDSQTPTWYYAEPRGLYGFISEGGGGASIPVHETVKRIIPERNLWPYNSENNYNVWNYHTARGNFANLGQITSFIDGAYGPSSSFDEFVTRAQILQYEMQRAQFEAINFNRYRNVTGFVNWMLNNAWPSFFWNQFDFYMNPNGTTYGARKGNTPVHIMYNLYNKSIHVVNNTFDAHSGAVATLQIFDIDGNLISTPLEKRVNIQPDGASEAVEYATAGTNRFGPRTMGLIKNDAGEYEPYQINYFGKITEAHGVIDLWDYEDILASLVRPTSDVFFIRLELKDAAGKTLSINTYAEPMRKDVAGASHAWNRSGAYQVHDLTQLNYLPPVNLQSAQIASRRDGARNVLTYRISNPTENIAYAVELKAFTGSDRRTLVAPVFYDDNLFTLLPGETREIEISYNSSDLAGNAFVSVNCYNNVVNGSGVNARGATNIYGGVSLNGSNNLARNRTVTGGTDSNNATNIPASGQDKANRGKTFIDSNFNTFATITPEQGSFVLDLGSVQGFDRIMLRWNRSFEQRAHNLRGRPDNIRIEISDDNATYTTIVPNYDNRGAGSIMTNIVLPSQVRGRYVRITPTGLIGISPEIGMVGRTAEGVGQSVSGIEQTPAATAFTLSAIEIYAFNSSAFFTVEGGGKVQIANNKEISASCNANCRVVAATNGTLTFRCIPNGASNFSVFRDNVDITSTVAANGTVTLTNVTADTDISVRF